MATFWTQAEVDLSVDDIYENLSDREVLKLVDLLVDEGLINNVSDLYLLTFDQLINLERMADKSANNLLQGLNDSKQVPFERVLFGLGIRFVGETVAKKLAGGLKNIENLRAASYDELIQIDEIGEKIAISIQNYFSVEKNNEIVNALMSHGLQFEVIESELATNILEGKSFVVSGVFESFSRDELKNLIGENGGKNVGSISSKTSFVLAGDNMGPSKLKKANDLNVPIISEADFKEMLGL